MAETTKSPLKHQLLVLGVIGLLGGVIYLATRDNPYATPETTFRTCMDAIARRDADAAWDCVDPTDRTKVGFIARRSGRVGQGEDPLESVFDEGVERYPDLADAVLERVEPVRGDADRVRVTISWGRWQIDLEMFRSGDEWRFDTVSEVVTGGVRPRARRVPSAD
jgi:hypothetical protein